MAQRELTDEKDRLDVVEYRNATHDDPQQFLCPVHNEQIRLIAQGAEGPILLTGCCDKGFDAFLEHVRGAVAYIKVFKSMQP